MKEAAIMNYRKALTLYPEHPEAKKRLLKVKGKSNIDKTKTGKITCLFFVLSIS